MTPESLKQISSIKEEPAVTLLLGTHPVHPERSVDRIALKNLVKNAENRLTTMYDKELAAPVIEKIREMEADTEHGHNLNGMVLFASPSFTFTEKLPVQMENRVLIGHRFYVRELLRAQQETKSHYVLCLSANKVRLIEILDDREINEITGNGFPVLNEFGVADDMGVDRPAGVKEKHYIKDFLGQANGFFVKYHVANPMQVVVAGTLENIRWFMDVARNPGWIAGTIEGSYDEINVHIIAAKSLAELERVQLKRHEDAVAKIAAARNTQHLLTDLNDIYRAAFDGRGDTLFVEDGYYQPAIIYADETVAAAENPDDEGVVDDIVNEIINFMLQNSGTIRFLPTSPINDYKLALVTRY